MLGHVGSELTATHWWSEKNTTCDCLSRLDQGAEMPKEVLGIPRTQVARRMWGILGQYYS